MLGGPAQINAERLLRYTEESRLLAGIPSSPFSFEGITGGAAAAAVKTGYRRRGRKPADRRGWARRWQPADQ